ncbi:hypothetical protein JCM10908_000334 [Rhodotorula pacifica]|uniref:uncharacterized protein n=1 Tax=Rhodotorula pacifica TaxID=1495444 RepID=UPI00317F3517
MSRYNGPPRHRPETLALGAGPHHQPYHNHQQQQPLFSAPLPHASQPAYAYSSNQQQQYPPGPATATANFGGGPRLPSNPRTAAALAEFQHAQQVYLAELNRTIEHQILVQQQVEREAAYRMLALQQQQREQYGLHQQAIPAANGYGAYEQRPYQQQRRGHDEQERQQQQQQQQQHVSLAQQATNPLVASALARRQRQERSAPAQQYADAYGHSSQQQGQREGAFEPPSYANHPQQQQRKTPSPPAVILSAPGEPYPDTSSSGSDSGETRPTSPESLAHSSFAPGSGGGGGAAETRRRDEAKQARRRSHLDALTHTVEHAEMRRKRRPVSIAGPADLSASSSSSPNAAFQYQRQQHYQHQQQQQQLSPRWPSKERHASSAHRAVSDPLLGPHHLHGVGGGGTLNGSYRPRSAASSSASSNTVVPPTPTPAPTSSSPSPSAIRIGPPPVPGTASAIRQPRGPPTDLDVAQNNFAARIRARAIESLKTARRRSSATAEVGGGAGGAEVGEVDSSSSLAASMADLRVSVA